MARAATNPLTVSPVLAAAHVPPELVDLKTPLAERSGVERGGGRGIDGQGVDVLVRQSCVGDNPRVRRSRST